MEEAMNAATITAAVSFSSPLELLKSRMQTMGQMVLNGTIDRQYEGIHDCLARVRRAEGARALWKGNSIGLLRYYPNEKLNILMKS
jgi:solute carrier family 25 (adenine nucleotide translocator) protein 4/5/6/31